MRELCFMTFVLWHCMLCLLIDHWLEGSYNTLLTQSFFCLVHVKFANFANSALDQLNYKHKLWVPVPNILYSTAQGLTGLTGNTFTNEYRPDTRMEMEHIQIENGMATENIQNGEKFLLK